MTGFRSVAFSSLSQLRLVPGRNELSCANDLLVMDHVTPKRKTNRWWIQFWMTLFTLIVLHAYYMVSLLLFVMWNHWCACVKKARMFFFFLFCFVRVQWTRCVWLQVSVMQKDTSTSLENISIQMKCSMKLTGHSHLFIVARPEKKQNINVTANLNLLPPPFHNINNTLALE